MMTTPDDFEKTYKETVERINVLLKESIELRYEEIIECTDEYDFRECVDKIDIDNRCELPDKFEDAIVYVRGCLDELNKIQYKLKCLDVVRPKFMQIWKNKIS